MKILRTIDAARAAVQAARRDGARTGLVPTMGALHRGHQSLISAAGIANDQTFVSIFVNPTQFGEKSDLQSYPRPIDRDLETCRSLGVAGVFVPTEGEMYGENSGDGAGDAATSITPPPVAQALEGSHRPGHFAGVCTVVLKLFGILPCDNAWFGKKDYQQWAVISAMVRDLNVPIEVVAGETVRDVDSLALSSRNVFLSPQERRTALAIPTTLNDIATRWRAGHRDIADLEQSMAGRLADTDLQYATIRDAATLGPPSHDKLAVALVATKVGQTRLIDNVELLP